MSPQEESEADRAWAPRTAPNACCTQATNLRTIERDEHVQVRQCGICNRRHFRALVPMIAGSYRMVGVPTRS